MRTGTVQALRAALTCVALAAGASSAGAQEALPARLQMFVGESRILNVNVRRVAVGNGRVLSVSTPTRGEMLLLAEGPGVSSVELWLDGGSRRHIDVTVADSDVQVRLDQVRHLLQATPRIASRIVGPQIVLEGDSLSENERERAANVAATVPGVLDFTGRQAWEPMIEFDVRIVEIRRDQLSELGLRWDDSAAGPSAGVVLGQPTDVTGIPPGVTAPGAFFGLATQLGSRINLLQRRGLARTLAEPRLTCRSGAVARFVAGGEIPLPVADGLGATDVEYKEYGIILEVRPRVDGSGAVVAEVSAELSQIDEAVRVQNFPGFLKRHTSTAVNLRPGETLVLAGLMMQESALDRRGVPGLSRVPLAGGMFRSKHVSDRETELLILLRPRTVSTVPRDEAAADASDDQRREIETAPRARPEGRP